MRYFKAQEKVPCWTKKTIFTKTEHDMLWWGVPIEVDVDHKFTVNKWKSNVLRFLPAEDWASKNSLVKLKCLWGSICCKFPVHKSFCNIPANFCYRLVCQILQAHPRVTQLPLHQSLECPKLNWRVCCLGLNQQFSKSYCVLLHQVPGQDPQRVPKNAHCTALAWQLQSFLTYMAFFAYKGCSRYRQRVDTRRRILCEVYTIGRSWFLRCLKTIC